MKHLVLATALNVRAEPSSGVIQSVLPRFAAVDEIEATADRSWIKIAAPGHRGWCSNGFLLRQDVWDLPMARIAATEFGIGEIAGPLNNPRIVEYQNSILGAGTNIGDEVSWCSSFIHWCAVKHLGKPQKGINAAARSWKKWGKSVTSTTTVEPGVLTVLWRREDTADSGKTAEEVAKKGIYGHVAFLAEPYTTGETRIVLLGGNQGNRVNKSSFILGDNYGILDFRSA